MTQIDFHVNAPAKLAYACRLARKGFGSGSRMVFYAGDPALLDRFDRELWTFDPVEFVPHVRVAPGTAVAARLADTPVWLATLPPDGPSGGFFNSRQPVPW